MSLHLSRRALLSSSAAAFSISLVCAAKAANKTAFEISYSDTEWKKRWSTNQYLMLRKEKTERKFSSPLLSEKRLGSYHCAGCDLPVYHSTTKYDSKTDWPSFYNAISGAIATRPDNTFSSTRTEVHCRRCGGHFGHIFNDGPQPTGKRHCLNGLALVFKPFLTKSV